MGVVIVVLIGLAGMFAWFCAGMLVIEACIGIVRWVRRQMVH
jgi:hypothetical protein